MSTSRPQRTPVVIANTLRMKRSQNKAVFLIVEGDDDKRFFMRHAAACEITVAHGHPNVVAILRELDCSKEGGRPQDRIDGVLAILDADFTVLNHQPLEFDNLLRTDFHDLEMTLVCSLSLERTLIEVADREKIAGFEKDNGRVLEHLLDSCFRLGLLRWASMLNCWGLKFDGVDFSRLVQKDSFRLDEPRMLQDLMTRGDPVRRPLPDEITREIKELERLKPDPRHVCCGHDVVEVLSAGLKILGDKNRSDVLPEKLEERLRLAHESSDFKKTSLCQQMLQWEERNSPFRVFGNPER